jgi:hypothetical protein
MAAAAGEQRRVPSGSIDAPGGLRPHAQSVRQRGKAAPSTHSGSGWASRSSPRSSPTDASTTSNARGLAATAPNGAYSTPPTTCSCSTATHRTRPAPNARRVSKAAGPIDRIPRHTPRRSREVRATAQGMRKQAGRPIGSQVARGSRPRRRDSRTRFRRRGSERLVSWAGHARVGRRAGVSCGRPSLPQIAHCDSEPTLGNRARCSSRASVYAPPVRTPVFQARRKPGTTCAAPFPWPGVEGAPRASGASRSRSADTLRGELRELAKLDPL